MPRPLQNHIACGWHTVRLAKEALSGSAKTALVIGGGAIGLGAALSLAAQGVSDVTIVEPNALRRDVLNTQCGQTAISPDDLSADAMFDLVIDGVGLRSDTRNSICTYAPRWRNWAHRFG